MHVQFRYDVGQDAENFIKSLNSKNRTKPTRFQRAYEQVYGSNYDATNVIAFIGQYLAINNIDTAERQADIEGSWAIYDSEFVARADAIFQLESSFWPIAGYLSTNSRCTYEIATGKFFLYQSATSPIAYVAHELFHFYTWYALHEKLVRRGVSAKDYNDFKESLTELLNMEFLDIMRDEPDRGYPQHAEMRARIRRQWQRQPRMDRLIETVFGMDFPPNSANPTHRMLLQRVLPKGMVGREDSGDIHDPT
jgi:hypothetical protein